MPNWNDLACKTKQVMMEKPGWPDGLSVSLQEELNLFDQLFLYHLSNFLLLTISDQKKISQLRRLFDMRWVIIRRTSMDYTLYPRLPSNQLVLSIAEQIRSCGESIVEMIMSTISGVIGTALPAENILREIEVDDRWNPCEFLVHSESDILIAVSDLFEMAQVNPTLLFSTKQSDPQSYYTFSTPLTSYDLQRISHIANPASSHYFSLLEKIHLVKSEKKPTLYFALETLSIALLKSSDIASGSDTQADAAACYQPIADCYAIWRALSEAVRYTIKNYLPKNNSRSIDCLESLLLCLFYGASMTLTADEQQRVKEEGVLNCTHQIGNLLSSVLANHLELNMIPIPGREAECHGVMQLPSEETLNQAVADVKIALKTRLPILGSRDDEVKMATYIFDELTKNHFNLFCAEAEMIALRDWIITPAELLTALRLMPSTGWLSLLKTISNDLITILAKDGKAWDSIFFILKNLPQDQWMVFCDALSDIHCVSDFILPLDLVDLAEEINEADHPALKIAIQKLSKKIIFSLSQVVVLFDLTVPVSYKKQYDIFQSAIDAVIADINHCMALFKRIKPIFWDELAYTLQTVMIDHLSRIEVVEKIFSDPLMSPKNKLRFFKAIIPLALQANWNPLFIKKICAVFYGKELQGLISSMKKAGFSRYMTSIADLENILSVFNYSRISHRAELLSILNEHTLFDIELKPFYQLINRFPECKLIFLHLFKKKIMTELARTISIFSSSQQYGFVLTGDFVTHFQFFFKNTLPLLLSREHIQEIAPSFFMLNQDALRVQFDAIETELSAEKISLMEACFNKMQLFHALLDRKDEYLDIDLRMCCKQLISYFGTDFFKTMLSYRKIDFLAILSAISISARSRSAALFASTGGTPSISHRPHSSLHRR